MNRIRRMLATDLDGTLVGHAEGLDRLKGVIERHRQEWRLVYATGRNMFQARRLQAEENLPEPDAWVTEVGASITYGDGSEDEAWRARMAESWDRATVDAIASGYPELEYQPDEAMGDFKVSFRLTPADAERLFPELAERLHAAGTPALLVYSSARDLDIVPAVAGKAAAIRHLMARWDIGLEALLTCGDSANDRDMLLLGAPAVAVGNAHAELVGTGLPAHVLHARGHCAEGILEALEHYRWIERLTARGGV